MTKEELYAHPGWRWCTFEGSREFDRVIENRLTFREKLEWLEEAETLSLNLQASRDKNKEFETQEIRKPGEAVSAKKLG